MAAGAPMVKRSAQRFVSSTISIVQILVHSYLDLVSSTLVQFATRTVAKMVSQMISSVAISSTSKEIETKAAFLF